MKRLRSLLKKEYQFTLTYSRKLYFKFCAVFLFVFLTMVAFQLSQYEASDGSVEGLETIYHIYVDDKRLGTVDEQTMIDDFIAEKINKKSAEYGAFELYIKETITLIPEKVFYSRANTEETLARLDEEVSVMAEVTALQVDGKTVLYVDTLEEAENVINQLKLQYIPESILKQFEKVGLEETDPTIVEKVGDEILIEATLTGEIDFSTTLAHPEDVLTVNEAVERMKTGVIEQQTYIVEAKDVLGSIAVKHDLSIEEMLELNPDITKDTLLQIGQELHVTAYEPIVDVISTTRKTVEEEIPFETEIKESESMWKGDSKVKQEGRDGSRIVTYEIVKENARTIKRKIIKDETVSESRTRVIIKGTKESPSRGTGNLSWPAIGGYISSYQGMRWGRFHKGIDIARPSNYSIVAADNGTVSFAGWNGGYGNTIKINHNNGMETLYAHLASIDVEVGDIVATGRKMGIMGTTGNSTGIHLHFEVVRNGKLENPMDHVR